jgi:hypothetical protein
MMYRRLLLLALLAAGSLLAGCAEHGVRHKDGRVEVRLWHSMGGVNGDALQKIAEGFNASQDTYEVRAVYQGGYPDSLKKLVSSFGTASMPAMIQPTTSNCASWSTARRPCRRTSSTPTAPGQRAARVSRLSRARSITTRSTASCAPCRSNLRSGVVLRQGRIPREAGLTRPSARHAR